MSAPRTSFPPPMTIATCPPCAVTSFTSCATRRSTAASRPARPSPERASPLSFNRMRSYLGVRAVVLFSELEPGEPPDLDIFAQSSDRLGDDVAHVPALVPDEWLLQKRHVLDPFLQPAIHRGGGLAREFGAELAPHRVHGVGGGTLPAHVLRGGGRHLHRQVARQGLEIFRARHKVGFAVHFDHRAHANAGMGVSFHWSFRGAPPGTL